MTLNKILFPALLWTMVAGAIPPVYADNDARHPMEGALCANYLAPADAGGAGVRIPLKRGSSLVISQCDHDNTFDKAIDGVRSYSAGAGGLALERSY